MVVTIAALVCFLVLTGAGAGHLRHLRDFEHAIDAQGVWPGSVTMLLAAAITALELGVGGAGFVSVAVSMEAAGALLLWIAASLYGCYALYGAFLVRWRPGVPCACSHEVAASNPIDAPVVGRAGILAALAALAALHTPLAQGLAASELTIVGLASITYALALWTFPAALRDPLAAVNGVRTG